ncbi:aminoglycoside phosphotransferase family protein [Sulfitobacter aestuarii]|uniref:Aminoglycoside phosphotransferase family protein n=1 Tax=Sulfitobacter aestuarii TaxID=2161676 RepID=A0ABW5U173_9RHOB
MTELHKGHAGAVETSLADFLAAHGHGGQALESLAADASARRYHRLPGEGLLLMEDRTDPTGFAAYLRLSRFLNGVGLSAPRVIAADSGQGLALIEDFGDQTYAACLAAGRDETQLYELAIDALLHLHHQKAALLPEQPRYDRETHLRELQIFCDWFAPAIAPDVDRESFSASFLGLWSQALTPLAERFDTLVLRDFHVDNLMLLEGRSGVARCGLLDFQDGVIGPCEYDLVSLLQDARRDLASGLEAVLLARYLDGAPAHLGAPADIRHRYALLGAQRHARILGVFVRLCQRDAKPRYLDYMPRVLAQFEQALGDAGLGEIAALLDRDLPDWQIKGRKLALGRDVDR